VSTDAQLSDLNVARELMDAAKNGALSWAVIQWEYRFHKLSSLIALFIENFDMFRRLDF